VNTETAATPSPLEILPPPAPTALVRRSPYDQLTEFAAHLDNLKLVSEMICKSTLLPRAMQSPANLQLVLAQGLEMGFTVMQAIRASFIIESKNAPPKVGYYVEGLVALVRKSSVVRFFRVEVCSAQKCRVVCARNDEDESIVHVFELTMEEAKAANLDKKWERDDATGKMVATTKYPWITAPSDMLRNRTSGRAVKSVFQDVIFGMATPDELDDLQDANVIEMMESGPGRFEPVPAASSATVHEQTVVYDEARPVHPRGPVAPETTTGDPGWDAALGAISKLEDMGGIVMAGWLPDDLIEEWLRRLGGCATRAEVNALSPWMGIVSQNAAKSKACADVAGKMRDHFNQRMAELRKAAEQRAAEQKKAGAQ